MLLALFCRQVIKTEYNVHESYTCITFCLSTRKKEEDFNEAISFLCLDRQNGARLPPVIASLRFSAVCFWKRL